MKAPMSRLFNVLKKISGSMPGMPRTTRIVPFRSMPSPCSIAATLCSSGIRRVCRWTSEAPRTTTASTSTGSIPPAPTSRPLITDVTSIDTPLVVPTMPLARSRRDSSNSAVTTVGRAIERRLPTITPSISSVISAHRRTLAGSVHSTAGVAT
jgi:hypothetical protein